MSRAATLRRALLSRRTLGVAAGGTLLAAGGGYYYLNSGPSYPPSTKETRRPPPPWTPPSRQQMLNGLKASATQEADEYPYEYDLLIVGGGATGAGVAVDAASRGLKVALVERDDFSAGSCILALGFASRPSVPFMLSRCGAAIRLYICTVSFFASFHSSTGLGKV